ncbi:MAG: 2-hydroxyacyl-CoA dehydratase subunit D [Thermodesulfobacteriota bacterium]
MGGQTKTYGGKNLSKIMAEGYMGLHEKAQQGAFCVWIAINVPAEIFSGFENVVYAVPESHSAMCAGKGVGAVLCETAENMGYSTDLCSYARIDIGSLAEGGKHSPVYGLPKPDLLVSNNNNCALLAKWFDVHHRQLDVPHFIMDVPFCYGPQQEKDRQYIIDQVHELIETIEGLSGQTFDADAFYDAVGYTAGGLGHWKRFLDCARHKPSAITAFDSFVHMAPFLTLRGTPEMARHFKILADEAEARIDTGDFPVPNEKYRLFWDNIAPWHHLRKIPTRLAEAGANIVGASYTSCMGTVEGSFALYPWDGGDGFAYIARTMNAYMCPHGMTLRTQAMKEAIGDLAIDGVIFASNRSCKPYSITQMDQQKHISDHFNVPAVMIEMDHADARKFNEESAFLRIEALIERIEAQKGK